MFTCKSTKAFASNFERYGDLTDEISFQSNTRTTILIPVDEDDAGVFQGLLNLPNILGCGFGNAACAFHAADCRNPYRDRGVQYVSIRYTERLAEAGIEPSVGSVGDSYDNALAETVIGLFKTEVIHRRGPWRTCKAVEFATREWVDWFNKRRLLEPIGNIPPDEAEARFYAQIEELAMVA